MAGDDDYQCTLTVDEEKVAILELNEVPGERLSSVRTFRDWIVQQPHIKCPTDTEYLLRYLRTAKFSQLRARAILEGFLTMKTELPEWYDDIDTAEKKVVAFLKSGFAVPLGFDRNGQYCLLMREGALETDNKRYTQNSVWQAMFALCFYLLRQEGVMVRGLRYLMDFTGFEVKHVTFWGMDTIKKSAKIYQGNFFGRFKGFHYYKTGAVFETLMGVMMPLLNKKMRDRIQMHGNNMEDVYKFFPKEILPVEYLPDDYSGPSVGSIESIGERLVRDITEPSIRKQILYETRKEWGIDVSKKPADIPVASFRKLNVD